MWSNQLFFALKLLIVVWFIPGEVYSESCQTSAVNDRQMKHVNYFQLTFLARFWLRLSAVLDWGRIYPSNNYLLQVVNINIR